MLWFQDLMHLLKPALNSWRGEQVIKECLLPCKPSKRFSPQAKCRVPFPRSGDKLCQGRKHYSTAQGRADRAHLCAPTFVIRTDCDGCTSIITCSLAALPGSRLSVIYSLSVTQRFCGKHCRALGYVSFIWHAFCLFPQVWATVKTWGN